MVDVEDVEAAINVAWQRVRGALLDDPHDLARRIARRRTPTLTRPPRAWCLAVRASDSRLPRIRPPQSTVTLTAKLLQRLCAPVTVYRAFLDEAAATLGTTIVGLTNARIRNILSADHYPLLAGRRGKPIPLLTSQRPLDPNARGFARADPAWIWTAQLLSRIPRDLHVTLTRIPHYISHVATHRYQESPHPELDAPRPRINKRLPPPQPDYVWYKWSRSGHFLGDDPSNWRKHSDDLGERPPRYLQRKSNRKSKIAKRKFSTGSLHFNGCFWICPRCNKRCRTIYYPLPRINLLDDIPRIAQCVDIAPTTSGFACARCHRIRFFTRTTADAWNQLVAYLTAGLLYGREVRHPSWFTRDRKRPYKPHFHPRPAVRRQQVLDRLLLGHTRARICAELHIKLSALVAQINKIYKSERVRGQRALLLKHKLPLPPRLIPMRHRVLDRLRKGQLPDEIAAELHVQLATVLRHIRNLRHEGKLPRRRTKRQRVAELHARGLARGEIAAQLNMTPQSVSTRLCELRRCGLLPPRRGLREGASERAGATLTSRDSG